MAVEQHTNGSVDQNDIAALADAEQMAVPEEDLSALPDDLQYGRVGPEDMREIMLGHALATIQVGKLAQAYLATRQELRAAQAELARLTSAGKGHGAHGAARP